MDYPLVTVITPTTEDRAEMNERLKHMVLAQDYPNFEHYWMTGKEYSLGEKRNRLCQAAKGEIIIHADSDDLYAPDWISKSVEHLLKTGAGITGLSSAYFYKHPDLLDYTFRGSQAYALGATMCYHKHVWQRKPFKDINSGEDTLFLSGNKVVPHYYKRSFLATLHGGNTSSHKNMAIFKKTDLNPADIYTFVEF